ncbi:MAG TPA: HlyD family efflux transporter periplasmic adaptor subunit [Candidatus Angelobacter sp.]|nr:HlyD family efflux transporter periplasmic adaptor subunit [Candidatus Angelobacter sp.]
MNAQQIPQVEQPPAETSPRPQPQAVPSPPKPRRARRVIVVLIVLLALAGAAFGIWKAFFSSPPVPDNLVLLSGRIEGDDSAVAPKTTGRILEVRFREGDSVKAGDVIAVLDDQQVRAREEQANAALLQALARSRAATDQINVLQEQLRQGEAEVAQQDAAYQLAVFDKEAYTRLAKSGAVSERQGKQAETTADQQAAALAAAKRRVAAVQMQIAQQQAEVASSLATTQQTRAQLVEAQANRQDLIVKAPFGGTVATRTAEPGEVVTAGTPIITLIDLNLVYLRGFIPEGQIGKVKLGQPARVYLDSNPKQPLDAYVSRIDPKATFTPENTYFRDDRVKQVVGVKLQLKAGFGYAKPGMPSDGEILTSGDHWPEGRWRK